MLALRNRSVVAFSGPFWLSALCVALAPTTIGYQDLAALLARQPAYCRALARPSDRLAVRHHSRRHVQLFASDRDDDCRSRPALSRSISTRARSDRESLDPAAARRWCARRCKSNIRRSTAASKATACRCRRLRRRRAERKVRRRRSRSMRRRRSPRRRLRRRRFWARGRKASNGLMLCPPRSRRRSRRSERCRLTARTTTT